MKRNILFLLFSLMGLLLAACAGTPASVETSGGSGAGAGASAGASAPAESPFTLDQLVATDPGTVQLASGRVQLVEFFAYW